MKDSRFKFYSKLKEIVCFQGVIKFCVNLFITSCDIMKRYWFQNLSFTKSSIIFIPNLAGIHFDKER